MQKPWAEANTTALSDVAVCRAMLSNGSKTFYAASFLLPRRVREPASALYAFCRLADDAVDHGGEAAVVLADLRRRLDLAYAGQPAACPADRAFAETVRSFAIPRTVPEALIEGFAWDFEQRRYETLAELEAYAARVAGTVGAMMAIVMGARSPSALARACDLGVAMQLTNIARDVGEDARAGRIYLPARWLREAGIDPDAWLARPVYDDRIGGVVARLLAEAERLYQRSEQGLAELPGDCRAGIRAARLLYAEIGNAVARANYDSVTARAFVPVSRKLLLLMRAYASRSGARTHTAGSDASIVEAVRFLIESAAASADALTPERHIAWWNMPGRVARIVELFERLERQERFGQEMALRNEKPNAMGGGAALAFSANSR
ncbi:MAG: phytoene/squalene synthase family protein [Hyphomicrobiaceae bacterium]|nr:phytoene/squalene synthase family protein [Hyphomicrobiaceae bacterium]